MGKWSDLAKTAVKVDTAQQGALGQSQASIPSAKTAKTAKKPLMTPPKGTFGSFGSFGKGGEARKTSPRPRLRSAPDLTRRDGLLAFLHELAGDFISSEIEESEADCLAFDRLLWIWNQGNPGLRVRGHCAACGARLAKGSLMLADGAGVCDGPDYQCLIAYGSGRRREAVDALARLGVLAPDDWKL